MASLSLEGSEFGPMLNGINSPARMTKQTKYLSSKCARSALVVDLTWFGACLDHVRPCQVRCQIDQHGFPCYKRMYQCILTIFCYNFQYEDKDADMLFMHNFNHVMAWHGITKWHFKDFHGRQCHAHIFPCMQLKRFVKLCKLEHGWQIQFALKIPKGLMTRFIPLLGYPFCHQVGQGRTTIEFHTFICNGHPFCINIANGKVPHLRMHLKMLMKIQKLEHMWWGELAGGQGSSHPWDGCFLNKLDKVLATLEKSWMKQR